VTVTLKDSSGAALPGKAVTLTGVGWPYGVKPQISPASATTASNGTATFTVTSADLGSGAFKAEDTTDSVTLSSQAKVSFLSPDAPDIADCSVTASPTSVPADGKAEATVTVTLMNVGDKPIAGMDVYLYQSGPGHKHLPGGALTLIKPYPPETPGVGLTASSTSGVATFTAASYQAEAVAYTAEVVFTELGAVVSGPNGPETVTIGTATVNFTTPPPTTTTTAPPVGPADAAASTVTVSPSSLPVNIPAGATVTVTLKDRAGRPVPGKSVSLSANKGRGGTTVVTLFRVSPAVAVTNVSGVAVFNVRDSVTGLLRLSVTDRTDSLVLDTPAEVTFTAAVQLPDAQTSTVVANPTDALAGPTGGSQVTVTLKDSSGAPVPDKVVTLTAVDWPPRVEPTISPLSATTGSNGVATFQVTCGTLGYGAFQAEDTTDSVTLTSQAKVSFLSPDVPDDADSSVAASPTSVPADGTSEATVTVTLMDIGDKPIARMGVYLYQSGPGNKSLSGAALTRIKPFPVGTPGVGEATSDSSGVATFTVTSGQAETVVYRAEVVFAAPGGTVSGENGPQTRTVGKATVIFITP
jgi:hypothetical protein